MYKVDIHTVYIEVGIYDVDVESAGGRGAGTSVAPDPRLRRVWCAPPGDSAPARPPSRPHNSQA